MIPQCPKRVARAPLPANLDRARAPGTRASGLRGAGRPPLADEIYVPDKQHAAPRNRQEPFSTEVHNATQTTCR